eukprot:4811514-Alexandrium_andersonii.AAC.1
MHTSRASGTKFEVVSGPAQFQVRTPKASSAYSEPPEQNLNRNGALAAALTGGAFFGVRGGGGPP